MFPPVLCILKGVHQAVAAALLPGIEREAVSYILILHDLWLFVTCILSTMVYANAAGFVCFCRFFPSQSFAGMGVLAYYLLSC